MNKRVSVVETLSDERREILEDENKFMERLRSVVNEVKSKRKDLNYYELRDLGFFPYGMGIKVKLYFVHMPGDASDINKA